jgi:hypothetical protein
MSGLDRFIHVADSISLSARKAPNTGIPRKAQSMLTAARHNLREIKAENGGGGNKWNPARTQLNEVLAGPTTAAEVQSLNERLFAAEGKDTSELRRDYLQGYEHVLSLEPGQDERGFFPAMVEAFKSHYGAQNILSATVHRDQGPAHIHILVSLMGGVMFETGKEKRTTKLDELRDRLSKAAKPIGFELPPTKPTRQNTSERAAAVIAHLEHLSHPMMSDPLWPALLKMINDNPEPLFEQFNLSEARTPAAVSQERLKKKPAKPIGIEAGISTNLSCVGIGTPPPPAKQAATASNGLRCADQQSEVQQVAAPLDNITRERDSDKDPRHYNPDTGEFCRPPPAPASRRAMADVAVRRAIELID